MLQDVIEVEPLADSRLLLTFESGERREVDVSRLVRFEGVFAPLQDAEFFRRVQVNHDIGTIVWPNGADLCPDVLYEQSVATSRRVA